MLFVDIVESTLETTALGTAVEPGTIFNIKVIVVFLLHSQVFFYQIHSLYIYEGNIFRDLGETVLVCCRMGFSLFFASDGDLRFLTGCMIYVFDRAVVYFC